MSFAKDKIIDDLHRENHALKTGPTAAVTVTHDLRSSEHLLKHSIGERVIFEKLIFRLNSKLTSELKRIEIPSPSIDSMVRDVILR